MRHPKTMTVAYCVAAYTRPSQCTRLVRRLLDDDPGCRVLLHYDQRREPLSLAEVTHPRVHILPERPLYWGSTQIIDLFVEMLRRALDDNCAYAVLLSGQDYPLRDVNGLETVLSAYDVWVANGPPRPLFASDGSCTNDENRRRYCYRWWHIDQPNKLFRGLDRCAAKVPGVAWSRETLPLPYVVHFHQRGELWWGVRTRGPGLPLYTGSVWMSLSARAIREICLCPRKVMSFFHHVPCPDEACFHTILASVPTLSFAPNKARYWRWKERSQSPEVLNEGDFPAMIASGAHFARKFDELVDASVLDRLDNHARSAVRD